MIPNNGITPAREEEFAFTAPVETFAVSIFVRQTTSDIRNAADLSGHLVGVVETNVAVALLQERDDLELRTFADVNDALIALLSGQVEALVYPEPVVLMLARGIGLEHQLKVVGEPLVEIKRAMAVKKSNTELLERLDSAVSRFVMTDEYQQIYVKWYGQPEPFWTATRVALGMGTVLLVTVALLVAWRYRATVRLNKMLSVSVRERQRAEEQIREYAGQLEEMVSERTRELQATQELLVRREKLAALTQLAARIGYELRNPLGVISNAIYYLKMAQPNAEEAIREYHEIVSAEVAVLTKIVSDLQSHGRIRLPNREEVAVRRLVAEVLAEHPVPEGVQVQDRVPSKLPPVYVDHEQIDLVLGTLVANAFQAMPSGGTLTVDAEVLDDMVELSVADTVGGIPTDSKDSLFVPESSAADPRVGIGLAISRGLVEANEGIITVDSEEGQGRVFRVSLPIREDAL